MNVSCHKLGTICCIVRRARLLLRTAACIQAGNIQVKMVLKFLIYVSMFEKEVTAGIFYRESERF